MVENNILDNFSPVLQTNPTYNPCTDASSFFTDALSNYEKYCGDFKSEERRIYINLLELKLVLD